MKASQLRSSILQQAVEGKLVPQRPEEGTAADLLESIRAERDALIKAGKIKKAKPLPEITEEEIPFEIPETWEWVRLGEIIHTFQYGTSNKSEPFGKMPVIRMGNLQNREINWDNLVYSSNEEDNQKYLLNENDVLFNRTNSLELVGKTSIYRGERPAIFAGYLIRLCYFSDITGEYLTYVLNTPLALNFYFDNAVGTANQANVSAQKLSEFLFPLPPLAEQKRIVAKLEELMPVIDAYEKEETKLSALEKSLPEKLRRSVLQQAVEGKLVPQKAEEGTASELLKEIEKEKSELVKAGKMKKGKSLPEISEDEIPFEIPESWEWVRLGNLSSLITKGTTPRGGDVVYEKTGIGFLRAENIGGFDKLNLLNCNFVSENTHNGILNRSILKENDILITIAGTLGRTALVRKEDLPLNINQAISIIRLINAEVVNILYLIYALNSPVVQDRLLKQKRVTAIPNLNLEIISGYSLPLPPLAEQKRIVAKVEELMQIIERM